MTATRQPDHIAYPDCNLCQAIHAGGGFGPSHDGSTHCESGSLASGGTHAHCTCDTCF